MQKVRRKKNTLNRQDVPADVLRQRRDLFATSFILLLFYIAGGHLPDTASATGLAFGIKFDRPWILLAAIWVAHLYFWLRFWLLSPLWAHNLRDDFNKQLCDSPLMRTLWDECMPPAVRRDLQQHANLGGMPPGHLVPMPQIDDQGRISLLYAGIDVSHMKQGEHWRTPVAVPAHQLWRYHRARLYAAFKAVVRERTFTDYALPHIVAVLAVVVGATLQALKVL